MEDICLVLEFWSAYVKISYLFLQWILPLLHGGPTEHGLLHSA